MRRFAVALALVVVLAAWSAVPTAAEAPGYAFTDLGTLGGEFSGAAALNENGQVVGQSFATVAQEAFLWQDGQMTLLPQPSGQPCGSGACVAYHINELGQIVGFAFPRELGKANRAVLWQDGQATDSGTLPGGTHSGARAINNRGQIVGISGTAEGRSHAVVWQGGQVTDLGTLPGGTSSDAYGISDGGRVVGYSTTATGERHAVLWQDGRITDLGTLPGRLSSEASDVNDRGQVVGTAAGQDGDQPHAVLWQDGRIIDLGTLRGGTRSGASAVNDDGLIVGSSTDAAGRDRAVLWHAGRIVDLGASARAICNASPCSIGASSGYCSTTATCCSARTREATPMPSAWATSFFGAARCLSCPRA